MKEEFRLYKGNSLTQDEVDTLLQHQIPDRPIPLQVHAEKTENCSHCGKFFGLLEWKHRLQLLPQGVSAASAPARGSRSPSETTAARAHCMTSARTERRGVCATAV
ncbi:hypothetical protein PINS_up022900 [Pythium insidiosum]|nr:hypothetical protein PINS_up022900 [Pythium insidiosum]